MLRFAFRAAVAASLVSSPIIAVAQVEASPPVVARASADVGESGSQLNGDYSPLIAIGLLTAIIIAALVISDDDGPTSP